ncbi:M48 family metalloprotease [Pontibacillus yanchengensis]|uniref:M48 family metalloprotease n=2 Tax=Pontibacillus yanchengensis TaxID=462910 RepID=A0A6I4ZWT8_9BACI|nr:M48 family metallopeptidase [Pontibacillus yanchengensis]MYL32322.1 M48 family metalloprotease [Pontibacillus yanchengensis]MYL52902.1 M48 family metalloprotease [Pontibacillus yanchengensis]
MKKGILGYGIFLAVLWLYFSFLYDLETYSNSKYAAFRHAYYFTQTTFTWVVLWAVLQSAFHHTYTQIIERNFGREWVRSLVYGASLALGFQLISLPLDILGYGMAQWADVNHQPIKDWLGEWGVKSLFFILIISGLVIVARMCMMKFRRYWWLSIWMIALPISLFLLYIQPVWIDPIFENFQPLRETAIKDEIVGMANEAGISESNIYEVNMSEKTSTFNAYVTGLGPQKRIVIWDTTIENMQEDEVLFILAHEIAHYVKNHVYWGVLGSLLFSLILLKGLAIIIPCIFQRFKRRWDLRAVTDLKSIPLLLLITSILLFATEPMYLWVSRQMELSADQYAIEHTDSLEPAIEGYRSLAVESKSDINPSLFVKWFRYTHPPIKKRIEIMKQAQENKE